MPAKPPTNWQERLIAALKQDPKKTTILSVLGCILAVTAGRYAFSSHGPASAAASLSAEASGNTPSRSGRAASFRPSAEAGKPLLLWLRTPIQPLTRNLYGVKLDYFPQDAARMALAAGSAESQGFWDQLAKSLSNEADQKKERQILLENLRTQAGQLQLQTTLMGAQPKAIVNGNLLAVGETVADFKVVRIESRSIVVEREGIRLEVQMK